MTSFNIYKASAGSGKTYTLVREYIKKCLSNKSTVSHKPLLAVTFTNKAASEMKSRIISTLFQFSQGKKIDFYQELKKELNYSDDQLQMRSSQVLSDIIHYYGLFSVSTIDKFLNKIIRGFTYELDLPSNFEIEMDTNNLLQEGVFAMLDEVGIDKDLTNSLIKFSTHKTLQNKSWDIEKDLINVAKELVKDQKLLFIHHITDSHSIKLQQQQLASRISKFEKKIHYLYNKIDILIAGIPDNFFRYKDLPNYLKKIKNNAYKNFELNQDSRLYKSIQETNWYSKGLPEESKNKIDIISSQLKLDLDNLLDYISTDYSQYLFDKECYDSFFLVSVLSKINQKIETIKNDNNIIHISEFNQIILKFLTQSSAPFIYEKVGHRYSHYFIDEFQDTSTLQWNNLIPLIEEGLSSKGSCLIVGDGKQSIYRWRGGEVNQFLDLCNPIKKDKLTHYNPKVLSLDVNYRSGSKIIDFNNQFFSFLSNKLTNEYNVLYEKLNQKVHSTDEGYIELSLIESNNHNTINEQTLRNIHQYIQECEKDNYKLSDIFILARKNNEITQIATYLVEQGIEVISSESLLLKLSPTIQFLLNHLKVLIDPTDYVSKAKLVEYLLNKEIVKPNKNSISYTIETYAKNSIEELEFFLNEHDIPYNTDRYKNLNLYELIENLIRDFHLLNTNSLFLTFFLDTILDFSCKYNNSILDFLNYWEQNKEKISIVIPPGVNAVEIMTIHKSKGLEFPVVIFPFVNWKEDLGTEKKWFDVSRFFNSELKSNLAITLLPIKKEFEKWPSPFSLEYLKHTQEVCLDNINLLYVALTRPIDRLYIITNNDKKKGDIFNYFLDFFNETDFKLTDNVFKYGQKNKNKETLIDPVSQVHNSFISKDWRNRLNIKQTHIFNPQIDNNKFIIWGNLMHDIMANINTLDDLEKVLKTKNLNQEDYVRIKKEAGEIIQSVKISHLFKSNLKVFSEFNILSPSGVVLRPDRVVVHSNKFASLIDYKTGAPSRLHEIQMANYEDVLFSMGFNKVDKYLVYLTESNVIKL